MSKPYTPINCSFYDHFEAFAVKRQVITLVYQTKEGENETVQSRIQDLFSREKVEYVLLENGLTIRLDEVIALEGIKNEGFCGV